MPAPDPLQMPQPKDRAQILSSARKLAASLSMSTLVPPLDTGEASAPRARAPATAQSSATTLPVIEVEGGRLYQRQARGNYYYESMLEKGRPRRSTGTNVLSTAILQVERYNQHGFPETRSEIRPHFSGALNIKQTDISIFSVFTA